jgi:hypothetical protein
VLRVADRRGYVIWRLDGGGNNHMGHLKGKNEKKTNKNSVLNFILFSSASQNLSREENKNF